MLYMHVCAYQRQKNALHWRLLSTVMGHCRCTELQKERGILRFPDFSEPLCRFHITTDSKARRRRHAPSVLQARSHCSRPTLSQIHLDSRDGEQLHRHNTSLVVAVFSHMYGEIDREPRRSVSQARLVNVVWRRRRMRPVFRPDSPPRLQTESPSGIVEGQGSFQLVYTATEREGYRDLFEVCAQDRASSGCSSL